MVKSKEALAIYLYAFSLSFPVIEVPVNPGLIPFSMPAEGNPLGQKTGTKGICLRKLKVEAAL